MMLYVLFSVSLTFIVPTLSDLPAWEMVTVTYDVYIIHSAYVTVNTIALQFFHILQRRKYGRNRPSGKPENTVTGNARPEGRKREETGNAAPQRHRVIKE